MEVPVGFIAKLWSFLSFIPIFLLLLTLGLLKGVIISPVAGGIIGIGKFSSDYRALASTLHLDLLLCGKDGCWSTIKGSFTVVQDFTDFCFHSYFSYMDELSEDIPADQKPIDIKLTKLPICLLAILIGLIVDVPMITVVALWKSPYMLFKGWKRLLEDLIGREGPFLETICIPFAALSIVLWPLAVVGAVISAFFSSLFLALYSAVIVHQEDSFRMGLAYIVAVISLFDEYANDLLYLREGSCFLRPRYRRNMSPGDSIQRRKSIDRVRNGQKNGREGSTNSKLVSERSWTLKCAIEQYTPIQIWDWLFKSCKVNGRILLHEGLIDVKDLEECILKGKSEKLGIKLPAWTLLQCLLASAKVRFIWTNCPKERLFEWFIEPLFVMKQQIKGLRLNEDEEICLKKLIMQCKNDKPEEWDDIGFPSSDTVRRAQLQAIIRRLQGIVCSMSRMPTFRRRFKNLVKVLCIEAIESGTLSNDVGGRLKTGYGGNQKNGEATTSDSSEHRSTIGIRSMIGI
ncbi:hypothetical protein Acr_17g0009620 [Actinidia rufa]|uniref:Transmembrane protein n=1 Tax=Actinidia rufa TaxID=165716 RepID=A0A7J0G3N7_9ERIC|nr:hypothetical protein Acr_17g0009620 [Actinidia rufa]